MSLWRISYLPHSTRPMVVEWVFKGTKEDLDKYLQDNHSCSCEYCREKDWWDSAEACEYLVEEITEEGEDEY